MIISNIHSQQNPNNRNWLLRTASRSICLFSFGWYFVEKLLNCYNDEYQYHIHPIHQFNGFSSVINPVGKRERESCHLLQPEQPFPFSEAKVAWGFDVGSKVKRQSRHGNNLHPHASGSILPMNLASDSPRKRASANGNDRPGNRRRKGKTTRGVCDGCNADGLPTRCSHCDVCKAGKQGRDGRRTGICRQKIP